ncbi:PREDICTED: alpha-1,3/1,6-mannosyltransferase ALG2-like [Branchiostoma belcheri]|uniref:Alpha-1,3/1,6-mannosyltransferase ALG2 n=1 Tax=Branchiostoma belcheri TaxID=7741 RepID=A0A6P5A7A9_BRABE|nr:PREDICTED: alpha-1,3/1,6-mannosyltransferase ALG2-like [Branchiostoma belcheri]
MVKVVFLHPDLGIGGAERLVVDAALALKSRGHEVHFLTAHHDPGHCFPETRDGSLRVTAVGDWLPRSVFGHCYALCAYLRMVFAALWLVAGSGWEYDVVFCDQISACVPFLRLNRWSRVIFYCHFPDQLLTQRHSMLKRLYRAPIDWLEETTTGMADCVLVNSNFTAGVFRDTFTSLSQVTPAVQYPSLNFSAFDAPVDPPGDLIPQGSGVVFLSINRYERKKNLGLAIRALGKLKEKLPKDKWPTVHLIMAGGYDNRVVENVEHHQELVKLAEDLGLSDHVTFLRSFSDAQKRTLLSHSTCLLYTPSNEHFGIVPLEAMYMKCPVIAVNSGGPLETVGDKETGFLCDPEAESFAAAMQKFVDDKDLSKKYGNAGRDRVEKKFSFEAFTQQLNKVVGDTMKLDPRGGRVLTVFVTLLFIGGVGLAFILGQLLG